MYDKILDMTNLNMSEQEGSAPQPPKDIHAQPNEETTKSKPDFAGRLRTIKTTSQARLQKVNQLLNSQTPQEEPQKPINPLPPEDVLNQLEILSKEEPLLPPAEFLSLSKIILQASDEIRHIASVQQRKLEQQRNTLRADLEINIDPHIQTLDRTRGIKRFFVGKEKGRLTAQKSNTQSQLTELENQIQAKQQLMDRIITQGGFVRQRQEKNLAATQNTLMTAVCQEIADIRSDYEQLLEDILQDGTMLSDIRETFIEQIIAPEVDKTPEENTQESEKDRFYQALRTYIDHGEEPDIRISDHKKLLRSFPHGNKAIYLAEPLLDGRDKEIIKLFVEDIAVQDTAPIRTVTESRWKDYTSNTKFSTILRKALRPVDKSSDINEFHQPKYVSFQDKIQLWQGVKYSKKANELFGNRIVIQDQQYYRDVLDKSVSSERDNQEAVRSLCYYPTPDAIRNLVLLASAFSSDHQDDRLNAANSTIRKLSARKDWPDILDNATKAYPSLKTARTILEKWTPETFSYRHPKIQDAIQDFALSVLESKQTDQWLITALAENALTNESILDILVRKNVLSNSDAQSLKEAERILLQKNQQHSSEHYIEEYHLRTTLQKILPPLLHQQEGIAVDQKTQITRFVALSQKILETNSDDIALSFLSSPYVIEKLQDQALNDDNIQIFLNAYIDCPALVTSSSGRSELLIEFCKQFSGKETVRFFKDICTAYNSLPNRQGQIASVSIIELVARSDISRERALELPTKAGDIINTSVFDLAISSPDIFLQTDEGLMFLREFSKKGLDLLDPSLNLSFGQKFFKQTKDLREHLNRDIKLKLCYIEFKRIDDLLVANSELEINESNWRSLLISFVENQIGEFRFSEQSKNRINKLFKSSHVKDFCLNSFRKEYADYLANGNFDRIPFALYLTAEYINAGGAGPLTQIESLSNFINSLYSSLDKKTITEESKNAAFQEIQIIENRFNKEKWSNENRTDFYNVSSNILNADANLFFDHLKLFKNLNPLELKRFMREIYPLYRAQLTLMEKTNIGGNKTYDEAQLVSLRKDVQAFTESIKTQEKPLENQKEKLIGEISRLFKNRFGIIKVPDEFTEENIRSLTNISTYLSNINNRDVTKEIELGYYLSLMLNNKWDDFRRGTIIDPKEFLDPKRAEAIAGILNRRTELNPLTPENLVIQESDIPAFMGMLQEEAQNVAIGDIETIDVKLNNVILNLRQLEDPDLYPEPLDKERIKLLLTYGNRKVGSTAAKMYQSLQNPSRVIQFSEDELQIKADLERIAKDNDFELTAKSIKTHFQEGIRPLSTVVNMLQFADETHAEAEIENIRQMLHPSQEIIDIFNRLGEEFNETSGALALSQDLNYLDNIIVKKQDQLTEQESMLLREYTGKIRDQVVKLQSTFDKIKDKFSSLQQGNIATNNELLKEKLDQINRIINASSTQQAVTSTMTNNLNAIIENMRECLTCTKKGINNDTNLTFGDSNKFYLYSQSEGQARRSIADEILFFEPIAHEDGTSEMSFVFDKIYGTQTPTISINHLETVIKKYRQLKQRFPQAKLSIFVTDSAIATSGLSQDMLVARMKNSLGNSVYIQEEQVEMNVAESAMSDHYIEFGGESRKSGTRKVEGITIRL